MVLSLVINIEKDDTMENSLKKPLMTQTTLLDLVFYCCFSTT